MSQATVETFRGTGGDVIVLVRVGDFAPLDDYELDHLSDVVAAYLVAIGFEKVVGPKSARPQLSDAELGAEMDDFAVSDQRASAQPLSLVPPCSSSEPSHGSRGGRGD